MKNKLITNILHYLAKLILHFLVNLLVRSLKITEINKENILNVKKNFVAVFWHGTMLVPWYLLKRFNMSALVSSSKDGQLLTDILLKWKYKVVRGSSNKKGKEALITLLEMGKQFSIGITPDGPKGPPQIMKAGAIILAKKNQMPLFLIGIYYKKKKILNSWDKFEIPYPFSEVVVIYSDAVFVNSELNYEQTDETIQICNEKLNQLQERAEEIVYS